MVQDTYLYTKAARTHGRAVQNLWGGKQKSVHTSVLVGLQDTKKGCCIVTRASGRGTEQTVHEASMSADAAAAGKYCARQPLPAGGCLRMDGERESHRRDVHQTGRVYVFTSSICALWAWLWNVVCILVRLGDLKL